MKITTINVHGQSIEVCDEVARDMIGNGELVTDNKTIISAINEIATNSGSDESVNVNVNNNTLIIN